LISDENEMTHVDPVPLLVVEHKECMGMKTMPVQSVHERTLTDCKHASSDAVESSFEYLLRAVAVKLRAIAK
jgi:hypothetical protein